MVFTCRAGRPEPYHNGGAAIRVMKIDTHLRVGKAFDDLVLPSMHAFLFLDVTITFYCSKTETITFSGNSARVVHSIAFQR